jgi:hypothetical protein
MHQLEIPLSFLAAFKAWYESNPVIALFLIAASLVIAAKSLLEAVEFLFKRHKSAVAKWGVNVVILMYPALFLLIVTATIISEKIARTNSGERFLVGTVERAGNEDTNFNGVQNASASEGQRTTSRYSGGWSSPITGGKDNSASEGHYISPRIDGSHDSASE